MSLASGMGGDLQRELLRRLAGASDDVAGPMAEATVLSNKYQLIGIHGGLIVTEGLLNCRPIQYVDYLGLLFIPWNIVGVLLFIIIIPAVAKERQTTSFNLYSHHSISPPN